MKKSDDRVVVLFLEEVFAVGFDESGDSSRLSSQPGNLSKPQ